MSTISDLSAFCKLLSHYDIREPWVEPDGYRYATDGWICVRVPDSGLPTAGRRTPKVALFFDEWPSEGEWIAWPPHDGTSTMQSCPDCDGEGYCECTCDKCGTPHDGGDCDCEGGQRLLPSPQQVAGVLVLYKDFERVAALPHVEYSTDLYDGHVRFRAGELQGIIAAQLRGSE